MVKLVREPLNAPQSIAFTESGMVTLTGDRQFAKAQLQIFGVPSGISSISGLWGSSKS